MGKVKEEWKLKGKGGSVRKLINITERKIPDNPSKMQPHKTGT